MSGSRGAGSQTISIVIVDDHDLYVEALIAALGDDPRIVIAGTAGTIEKGILTVRDLVPDVVLMDQQLPDGEGVDGARTIKRDNPTVKVVMVTQFAEDSLLLAALDAGCSGYITKGMKIADLVQAIHTVAAGEAAIPAGLLGRVLPKLRRTQSASVRVELTRRELEVLRLLAQGVHPTVIARTLTLSVSTVRNHIQSILTKLGVHSQLEAVTVAVRSGLVRVA